MNPEELMLELEYVLENYDTSTLGVRVKDDLYSVTNWFVTADGITVLETDDEQ